jgi:hypothetical protein
MGKLARLGIIAEPSTGKTTLINSFEGLSLVADTEGGTAPLDDRFDGRILDCTTLEKFEDVMTWLAGPDVFADDEEMFGPARYARMVEQRGGTFQEVFPGTEAVFVDSYTRYTRMLVARAERSADGFTKEGKKDPRGAYGRVSRDINWFFAHALQIPVHVVFTAVCNPVEDDLVEGLYKLNAEGGSAKVKFFDELSQIGMLRKGVKAGEEFRYILFENKPGVATGSDNDQFSLKDRSYTLGRASDNAAASGMEPANMQVVLDKIGAGVKVRAVSHSKKLPF